MLTKVIFEYSDGTKKYLEGEDVQKWHTYNEQLAVTAMIRGICLPFDKLEWKLEGKHDNRDEQKEEKEE